MEIAGTSHPAAQCPVVGTGPAEHDHDGTPRPASAPPPDYVPLPSGTSPSAGTQIAAQDTDRTELLPLWPPTERVMPLATGAGQYTTADPEQGFAVDRDPSPTTDLSQFVADHDRSPTMDLSQWLSPESSRSTGSPAQQNLVFAKQTVAEAPIREAVSTTEQTLPITAATGSRATQPPAIQPLTTAPQTTAPQNTAPQTIEPTNVAVLADAPGTPATHRNGKHDAGARRRAARSAAPSTARRKKVVKPPRGAATGLSALLLLALVSAFLAWVSAEPLWLALHHAERGTVTVTRCVGNGPDRRCMGTFTSANGHFTRAAVPVMGDPPAVGGTSPARMTSSRGDRAYVHTNAARQAGLGMALLVLCGVTIAWATGAVRVATGRRRLLVLLACLAGPLLLLGAMLATTF